MFKINIHKLKDGRIRVVVSIDKEYDFTIEKMPEKATLKEVIDYVMKDIISREINRDLGD